ncbi:MAG: DUF5671 domain-containing protein [Candidatus Moraniibacteriota bacterium]
MENEQLIEYVLQLIQQDKTKQEIKDYLSAVGWPENEIDAAYAKALIRIGVPVPSEAMQTTFGKKSSTAEIAVNFLSFILLGIVAISLGTLLFQVIGKYFPDPLVYRYGATISSEIVHYSIAALIIAFPLYWLAIRFWFRSFLRDEGKMETTLTKWLTYLVLLVASLVIVGDLITVLFTFLQGEISARFFLKALTILLIAGLVFGFYFLERRKIQYRRPVHTSVFKTLGGAVSFLIFLAIVLGFMAGGSPATERKRTFDEQRASDLSSLENCIQNFATKYKRLPTTLADLEKTEYSYCASKKDPETGTAYEYRVIQASRQTAGNIEGEFELCANFSLSGEYGGEYYNSNKWREHTAGLNCDSSIVVLQKGQLPNTQETPASDQAPENSIQ